MNKIKSFSLFESSSNQYWSEIDYYEFISQVDVKNTNHFNNKVTDILDKFLSGNPNCDKYEFIDTDWDNELGESYSISTHSTDDEFLNSEDGKIIDIYELDDEWFYLHESTITRTWSGSGYKTFDNYYKCDQIQGVIELLKEIL